jgi:L-lactate dehydrogenase complex protein LldG
MDERPRREIVMSADDREQVFASVRQALANRTTKTPRPQIDGGKLVAEGRLQGEDLWGAFAANFTGVRGFYHTSVAEVSAFLKNQESNCGYCDPAFRELVGEPLSADFEIVYEYSRAAVDAIDFGITAATSVIAETGTIILNDRDTTNRLAALAPWVHIAVAQTGAIHRTLVDAIAAFGDDPNIVMVTGPSKTADVEGIMIEGVHAPGEQILLRID